MVTFTHLPVSLRERKKTAIYHTEGESAGRSGRKGKRAWMLLLGRAVVVCKVTCGNSYNICVQRMQRRQLPIKFETMHMFHKFCHDQTLQLCTRTAVVKKVSPYHQVFLELCKGWMLIFWRGYHVRTRIHTCISVSQGFDADKEWRAQTQQHVPLKVLSGVSTTRRATSTVLFSHSAPSTNMENFSYGTTLWQTSRVTQFNFVTI